jgi:hypothetical protein
MTATMDAPKSDNAMLDEIQRETFDYFLHEVNGTNGLIADSTRAGWPCSIAATGLALAAYPIAVERGLMTRADALERTLTTLRFFWNSPHSEAADATGYKGFYYHFLDMKTGRRAWQCELSTVDSTFLLAGALTAAAYFDQASADEQEVRGLADRLYRRADWQWAQNGEATVTHGWKPESGFLPYRWEGYDEALLLYVLGLGSPTYPLPEESYQAWLSSYVWKNIYGYEHTYAGPLFIHQLSHVWIDFRGIQDECMRKRGIDYFENSRRATLVQQHYAIENPRQYGLYSRYCWGITASDGPGPATLKIDGIEREFYGYLARGAPFGPDDGTLSPWAAVTSLPFAPEIVLPTIRYLIDNVHLKPCDDYGFEASFNAEFPDKTCNEYGWVCPWHLGLNQGPIVLMIENYRTGFLWRLMRECPHIITGLRRAGFRNGWL